VVDIPLRHHDDVFANVVLVVVLLDHLLADGLHVGYVAEDGETDLLLAKDAAMCDLDGGLKGLRLPGFQELPVDGASFVLDVLPPVEGVGEHVAYYLNGSLDVLTEDCHHIRRVLPRGVGIQIAADILDFQLQIMSSSNLSPLEMEVL
jgi:hypothetical protein